VSIGVNWSRDQPNWCWLATPGGAYVGGAALDYGASTETAVSLMRSGALSRPGALQLAAALGASWDLAAEALRQDDGLDIDLTTVDRNRLEHLRAALREAPE
jgi:hypothetical protein